MLKRLTLAFAVFAIVSAGTWEMFQASLRETPRATAVSTSVPGIGALGRIEPRSEVIRVNAPSVMEPAQIDQLLVKVGDTVEQGQLLAILDSQRRNEAAVAVARASHEMARRALDQVLAGARAGEIASQEAEVRRTEVLLQLAEKQLQRAVALLPTKSISTEDYDERQSQVEARRNELEQARATLTALREIRDVDVRHAEADVVRTEAAIESALADLETSVIKSPIAGRILRVHARSGERVGVDGLLDLGDVSRMDVVAEVHEADIPRVRLGQDAEVSLQTWNEQLQGEVVEIGMLVGRKDVLSNDPVEDTDARVIEVRVRLDEAGSRRVEGLSYAKAEVTIHVDSGESQPAESSADDHGERQP
jgi:HlyD family secretion protein